jgi:hypothetical protein
MRSGGVSYAASKVYPRAAPNLAGSKNSTYPQSKQLTRTNS